MMKAKSRILFAVATSFWAQNAFAFFDAALIYGSRTSTIKEDQSDGTKKDRELKGTDIGATFLLDPIPLVPVAFGLMVKQGTTNYDDTVQAATDQSLATDATLGANYDGKGTGTSKHLFYGTVFKVWAPIPIVKPYLKAAYLLGAETIDTTIKLSTKSGVTPEIGITQTQKTVMTHTGSEISLGLGYSPIKLTSVFFEYSIHNGKRKTKARSGETTTSVSGISTTVPINGTLSDDDKKEETWGAKSINFGVSVGL
jgi:hypothetical protein